MTASENSLKFTLWDAANMAQRKPKRSEKKRKTVQISAIFYGRDDDEP